MRARATVSAFSAPIRTRRSAFTLVEVMVVIAIIAVLISILLPSLRAVRITVRESRTRVTISVLETGIHQFLADSRCGGSLPPSLAPITTVSGYDARQIKNPHTNDATQTIAGASLLLWALAGADLLGTPGFQDLNGNGTWADDMGNGTDALPGVYALNASGQPIVTRSGPFVDLSKMKLPRLTASGFEVPAVPLSYPPLNRCLFSLCFLDSFDQPILYYRATPANTYLAYDPNLPTPQQPGIYNLLDNARITGSGSSYAGMDLGHGVLPPDGVHPADAFHYLGTLGNVQQTPDLTLQWLRDPNTSTLSKLSFGYTIWNRDVTAVPRPHNEKSFILLSAGQDGIFGTTDDIANFEVNK